MSRLFLFTATGSRGGPMVASVGSVALHGAMAFAVLGVLGAPGRNRILPASQVERQLEVEVIAGPSPDSLAVHRDVVSDDLHDHHHAAPHSHPYPLPPDHDATPHSPEIDHRAPPLSAPRAPAPAEAPRVVVAPVQTRPTFTIALGGADATRGGAAAESGAADGSGQGSQINGAPAPQDPAGLRDALFSDADVSAHARLATPLRPDYPAGAREQGIEATVTLEIVIDRDGSVADVRVLKGAGYGFDDSALRALRRARFSPAIRDGRPVRVRMPWTIDFRLE
jgi:TonB family protein